MNDLRVSTSPEFLESIANDPQLFPLISPDGVTPFSFAEDWPHCIGLEFDAGGWIFERYAEGTYGAHFLLLPSATDVPDKFAAALRTIFLASDAEQVFCRASDGPGNTAAMLEAAGFRKLFWRLNAGPQSGEAVGASYYRLSILDWIPNNLELLLLGQEQKPGVWDLSELAFLGFLEAATSNGQHEKGVRAYNTWALMTGADTMEPAPCIASLLTMPAADGLH